MGSVISTMLQELSNQHSLLLKQPYRSDVVFAFKVLGASEVLCLLPVRLASCCVRDGQSEQSG